MYLTTGLEAALKAACTPRQLTSTVSLFLSSQPAGIDVAVQVDAPLVKFGGVKAGSASSTIHPKLATRWKLSGCESLVASIGRDLKLAALYKWETSLPLSDSGTRQDRPRSEPSTQLPRTPVNIYGPVGAEAYADALFGIQNFRENNPMLSTALKRRRANNSRNGKDSHGSGEGEEEEGDNKHNNVTLLLGAELDVRAPTLLHKLGCVVNVKL